MYEMYGMFSLYARGIFILSILTTSEKFSLKVFLIFTVHFVHSYIETLEPLLLKASSI